MWNDLPYTVFDTRMQDRLHCAVNRWFLPWIAFSSVFHAAGACGFVKAIYNNFVFPNWVCAASFNNNNPSHMYSAIILAWGVLPCHNKTGQLNPGTSNFNNNADLSSKSQSRIVYRTGTKPQSGHSGFQIGPTHYYRVFCRQQEKDTMGLG